MSVELVREIFTVASLLIKFDSEDILERRVEGKRLFIEVLNELGIRNTNNKPLTESSFKKLIQGLSKEEKESLIEEFNQGFQAIYCRMAMHS
ncbi:anti-sigma 70 protein [Serratia phage 4S]|nr:anti-sigma 70 protein [Serratia phage 4S]